MRKSWESIRQDTWVNIWRQSLACAVAIKAMEILVRDDYPQIAAGKKAPYFMERLRQIKNPHIKRNSR